MKTKQWIISVIIIIIATTAITLAALKDKDNYNKRINKIYEEGQNAAKAGIPPECNPYKDHQGSTWLNGYINKKNDSHKQQ
jgi:hypothetical protein